MLEIHAVQLMKKIGKRMLMKLVIGKIYQNEFCEKKLPKSFLCAIAVHCFHKWLNNFFLSSSNYNFNCFYYGDVYIHTHLILYSSNDFVVQSSDDDDDNDDADIHILDTIWSAREQRRPRRNVCMKKNEEMRREQKQDENNIVSKSRWRFQIKRIAFQNVMNFDTLCALLNRDMRPPSHTSSNNTE